MKILKLANGFELLGRDIGIDDRFDRLRLGRRAGRATRLARMQVRHRTSRFSDDEGCDAAPEMTIETNGLPLNATSAIDYDPTPLYVV